MQGFDWFVVIALGFFTLRGAWRGAIWQLASFSAFTLSFVAARAFGPRLGRELPVPAPLGGWLAMFLIYMLCAFVIYSFARSIRKRVKKADFGEYDRHMGAVMGFLTGTTLCLVITFFAVTLSGLSRASVMRSASGRAAVVVLNQLRPVLPAAWQDTVQPLLSRLPSDTDSAPGPTAEPTPSNDPSTHWSAPRDIPIDVLIHSPEDEQPDSSFNRLRGE